MKILFILSCILILNCGGGVFPDNFIKPTINKKIAIILQNYQRTHCKVECLIKRVDNCYTDKKTLKKKCVKECPLEYKGFYCIDLYKIDGKNTTYFIEPFEWQTYFEHLTTITFLSQDIQNLTEKEFLCKNDYVTCEDNLEVIQTLQKFIYEIKNAEQE